MKIINLNLVRSDISLTNALISLEFKENANEI